MSRSILNSAFSRFKRDISISSSVTGFFLATKVTPFLACFTQRANVEEPGESLRHTSGWLKAAVNHHFHCLFLELLRKYSSWDLLHPDTSVWYFTLT